jgi:squalene synthase HpnC
MRTSRNKLKTETLSNTPVLEPSSTTDKAHTDNAYQACLHLAQTHYENFPVASRLLPAWLRPHVAAIYAFARHADDFADEGDFSDSERLEHLNEYRHKLYDIEKDSTVSDPVFIALKHTIETHRLPTEQFHKLLSAFKQDVTKKRYANIAEVLDYCDRSANPVGYLLLCLFNRTTEKNIAYSNNICSALQIINFLQDISVDYQKDRIYLPQDELQKYRITGKHIAERRHTASWKKFMGSQLDRVEAMMLDGAPLAKVLPGRTGLEIRATVVGGLSIINKLRKQNLYRFPDQPRLDLLDWVKILATAIYYPYK